MKKQIRETYKANQWAFTLIELLTVIAVIGVLAALLFPAFATVKKHALIQRAQTEMGKIEAALESYKSAYGFYPPDNTNNALVNPLYYELLGTTNNGGTYQTLDGSASINADTNIVSQAFNGSISGFINCNRANEDESARPAKNFLPELKSNQLGWVTNPPSPGGTTPVAVLLTSVGGPDASYKPLGAQDLNPWRYNSHSPTNNPGAYDLWVQLVIGGKTNLICNWRKQVQINNPLP
ncbi:MAG TPA: type II secretion system protein [Verrucomicrobiae bacterium]|nr:type II secretion system protein [Verrucomicrobiae bacterium]